MAKKGNRQQHTAEDHVESVHEDHIEGTAQPIPETVTREEFNQFTANLMNTFHIQQKMVEEMMQHLAQQGHAPTLTVGAPPNEARGIGGSFTAGQYRSSINHQEDRPRECHEEGNQRSLKFEQSCSGSRRDRRKAQRR